MVSTKFKSLILNRKLALVLTLVMASVLAMSIVAVLASYKAPIYVKEYVVKSLIDVKCGYNYVVSVRPSVTYSNRSVIKVGEPLYFRLLKEMNINLTCRLSSLKGISKVVGSYNVDLAMNSSAGWMHYIELGRGTVNSSLTKLNLKLNIGKLLDMIDRIDKEIGVRGVSVIMNLRPVIKYDVVTNNVKKHVLVTPVLSMLISYDKGVMSIDGLRYHKVLKDGEVIRHINNITLLGLPPIPVVKAREYSLIAALTSSSGLVLTLVRPSKKRRLGHKEISSKYSDLIIDGRLSEVGSKASIIDVSSIKDLANLAEALGRPILHSVVNRVSGVVIHRYYVTDGSVVYRYTLQPTTKEH